MSIYTRKRPVLKLPLSTLEKVLELLSAVGFLAVIIITVTAWGKLPDRIPIHFGITGNIDSMGTKNTIWLKPAVIAGLYVLLSAVARFPHINNYIVEITEENAERQYRLARTLLRVIKLELILIFVYIQWMTVQSAFTKEFKTGLGIAFIPVVLVAVFGTIIFYIFKSVKMK